MLEYFSKVKRNKEDIEEHYSLEVGKYEIFSVIMSEHEEDWYLIKELYEDKALTLEEKKELLDVCYATMKKQVEIVLDVYEKGKPRTRHPKRNNKKQNNQ